MYAAISADIVSSTSLSRDALITLNLGLKNLIIRLETMYPGVWGRIVRGDTLEFILVNPVDALEVSLLLKTYIKAFEACNCIGSKEFNKYGLRIAIGIGDMKTNDRELDIMDGDAIYRSGRALNGLVGRDKYSFVISMADKDKEEVLQVVFSLLNQLINGMTRRQSQILYERLIANDTYAVANKLQITVSGVNQTLNKIGWATIEGSIMLYRKLMNNL